VYGSSSADLPPPPPEEVAAGLANPRYVYLIGRLRNRQITMEEATELFTFQQQLLSAAMAPRATTSSPSRPPSAVPTGPSQAVVFNDEGLALSLLAMGAGAGVLAAVLKRAQEGPRKPSD
jgi:hypothetical protein